MLLVFSLRKLKELDKIFHFSILLSRRMTWRSWPSWRRGWGSTTQGTSVRPPLTPSAQSTTKVNAIFYKLPSTCKISRKSNWINNEFDWFFTLLLYFYFYSYRYGSNFYLREVTLIICDSFRTDCSIDFNECNAMDVLYNFRLNLHLTNVFAIHSTNYMIDCPITNSNFLRCGFFYEKSNFFQK